VLYGLLSALWFRVARFVVGDKPSGCYAAAWTDQRWLQTLFHLSEYGGRLLV
jgi:hypothetical protein